MRARTAIALALSLCGCSALGLDGFPIFTCQTDAECDPLNDDRGITAERCARWQCEEASGSCVLRDRRDDDDDGVPSAACGGADCDDADPFTAPGRAIAIETIAETDVVPEWASWGDGSASPSLAFGAAGSTRWLVPGAVLPTSAGQATDADLASPNDPAIELRCAAADHEAPSCLSAPVGVRADTCQTHEECQDADFCNGYERCAPTDMGIDARGCKAAELTHCGGAGQVCDEEVRACLVVSRVARSLDGLAAAPLAVDRHLAAAIEQTGCAAGTLRIGWLSASEPDLPRGAPGPNVLSRGNERRTPGYYGIDVVGAESTGAEVSCDGGGDPVLDPEGGCTGRSRAAGEPRGVSSLRVATLEPDPARGRLRPQGLVAWLAAPRCRETGACAADAPASIELLGAWEEQALGRDAIELVWTTISDDGVPRALGTRTIGRSAPAIASAGAGYVVAYAGEAGGIAVFVEALDDPPEVDGTAPHRTALSSMTRSTLPLVVHPEQPLRAGAPVSEVGVAAGVPSGDTVPLGLAWIEDGAPWFARATLRTTDGSIMVLDTVSLGDGPASAPSIVPGEMAGFGVAFERDGAVWLARVTEAGALHGEVTRIGGQRARFPRAMLSAGGALRAGWYEPGESAFVRSSGLCPGGE